MLPFPAAKSTAIWSTIMAKCEVLMWRASLLDLKGDDTKGADAKKSNGTSSSERKLIRGDPSTVLTYFPQVENDASKVTWAHRVNSVKLLKQSLQDDSILMLEADILRGNVRNSDARQTAIMAHPPDKDSDLTFDRFIDEVIKADAGKGVKLDFKDLSVVEECLQKLKSRSDELNFPVWLNADIIAGPVKAKKNPVDADVFLRTCKMYFPTATLSLGWTIDVPKFYLGGGSYKQEHVEAMLKALERNEINQPVTFPVFGLFAHNSVKTLGWLLDNLPGSSLTVWGGKVDSPYHNRRALARMRDELGRERVYFDVPYKLPNN